MRNLKMTIEYDGFKYKGWQKQKIEVLDRPILEKRKVRLDAQANSRKGKIVLETEGLAKGFGEMLLHIVGHQRSLRKRQPHQE